MPALTTKQTAFPLVVAGTRWDFHSMSIVPVVARVIEVQGDYQIAVVDAAKTTKGATA